MSEKGALYKSEASYENIYKEATSLFRQVRDIPYRLGLDGNPNKLFRENAGNCTRKHLRLIPDLVRLGYTVKLGVTEFDWRELPVPSEILKLLRNPIDTHLFLYVSLNGNEMKVDATWDSSLQSLGFKINDWNGYSSTDLGVRAQKIIISGYQILQLRTKFAPIFNLFRKNKQEPTPFNDAFNTWLGR